MARRKRVTIKQVAREAGVSTQTVSRVINDRPDVSPETRRLVQEIIDRLGYRPSHVARSLSQGQSCTIGVVAFGIEYFGPSRAVSGIEKQAAELGYTPLLYLQREPESNNVGGILDDLMSRHVDGIIWAIPEIGGNRSWLKEQVPSLSVPLIFHSMEPQPNLSVSCVDNHLGGRIATEHLLAQGYETIALISGPMSWWEANQRASGWRDVLVEAAITVDDSLMASGNWTAASGERAMIQLLEQRSDIDAIFACNDQMALGALQVALRNGLRVPQDLAIVGFDDAPEAAYFWPPLTTVSQPLFDMGRASVVELHRLIEASRTEGAEFRPATRVLKPQLVVRESSAVK